MGYQEDREISVMVDSEKYRILGRKAINVDITHRCPLECPRCQRQMSFTHKGIKVPGGDITMEDFRKVLTIFDHINFCGQVSDPIHHPKFIQILKMIYDEGERCMLAGLPGKSTSVHHATGYKKMDWYIKAFQANPKARWWFGIDGTPDVSHQYRINQDGQKLFEIMCEAVNHLEQKPVWQYIVFNYNEDPEMIERAKQMADDAGVQFMLVYSSRWLGENDPYRPVNPELALDLRKN